MGKYCEIFWILTEWQNSNFTKLIVLDLSHTHSMDEKEQFYDKLEKKTFAYANMVWKKVLENGYSRQGKEDANRFCQKSIREIFLLLKYVY